MQIQDSLKRQAMCHIYQFTFAISDVDYETWSPSPKFALFVPFSMKRYSTEVEKRGLVEYLIRGHIELSCRWEERSEIDLQSRLGGCHNWIIINKAILEFRRELDN